MTVKKLDLVQTGNTNLFFSPLNLLSLHVVWTGRRHDEGQSNVLPSSFTVVNIFNL